MKRIVVFDMGGGTLDVSVLMIEDGVIEVMATRGDTHLGGQDMDEILIKHCMDDFKNRFGIDLSNNNRARARLRNQSRQAKEQLSTMMSTMIEAESLAEDNDYSLNLSRAQFEQLMEPIF